MAIFYAILVGGLVVLARAARSRIGATVTVCTAGWLFAGLVGWWLVAPAPPGWLVLLVAPSCGPIGLAIERAWPRRQPQTVT